MVLGDDGGVEKGAEHHADHEGGEYVSKGEVGLVGVFLECGNPKEDEEVH